MRLRFPFHAGVAAAGLCLITVLGSSTTRARPRVVLVTHPAPKAARPPEVKHDSPPPDAPAAPDAPVADAGVDTASKEPPPSTTGDELDSGTARSSPLAFEAQLRAELRASGFEVAVSSSPLPTSPTVLAEAAKAAEAFAALAVERPEGGVSAEIWVVDRLTGKTLLRNVTVTEGTEDAQRILALRAVELLRASLLELNLPAPTKEETADEPVLREAAPAAREWVRPPKPKHAPAPIVVDQAPSPSPPPPHPRRFEFAVGATVLAETAGLETSVAPSILVSFRPLQQWAGELAAMGPLFSSVRGEGGSAEVDQELLAARLRFEPWPGSAPSPHAVAGVGAYRIGVSGRASEPYTEQSGQRFAMLATLGVGGRLELYGGVRLLGEINAVFVTPRPVVRFAGRGEAKAGAPSAAGTAGLEVSW